MLWIQQLSNGNSSNFTKLIEHGLGNHGPYSTEQLRQLLEQFKERFVVFQKHEIGLDLFSTPYHFDPDRAATRLPDGTNRASAIKNSSIGKIDFKASGTVWVNICN